MSNDDAADEYKPRTGNFLSDLKDEFESYGRGSFIQSFVSGGPKFYEYIVRTSEGRLHEICKVKGITLNYNSNNIINFNSIKDMIIARERHQRKDSKEGRKKKKTKQRPGRR